MRFYIGPDEDEYLGFRKFILFSIQFHIPIEIFLRQMIKVFPLFLVYNKKKFSIHPVPSFAIRFEGFRICKELIKVLRD